MHPSDFVDFATLGKVERFESDQTCKSPNASSLVTRLRQLFQCSSDVHQCRVQEYPPFFRNISRPDIRTVSLHVLAFCKAKQLLLGAQEVRIYAALTVLQAYIGGPTSNEGDIPDDMTA